MWRVEGWLLIPHELLHLAGYSLVGKRCRYRMGDDSVAPVGPLTPRERLVGLLFPFAACLVAGLVLLALAVGVYVRQNSQTALALWLALPATLLLIYAGVSLGDLRQVYLLLFGWDRQQTPFDWLFWPFQREHGPGLQVSSVILFLISLVLLYASLT